MSIPGLHGHDISGRHGWRVEIDLGCVIGPMMGWRSEKTSV